MWLMPVAWIVVPLDISATDTRFCHLYLPSVVTLQTASHLYNSHRLDIQPTKSNQLLVASLLLKSWVILTLGLNGCHYQWHWPGFPCRLSTMVCEVCNQTLLCLITLVTITAVYVDHIKVIKQRQNIINFQCTAQCQWSTCAHILVWGSQSAGVNLAQKLWGSIYFFTLLLSTNFLSLLCHKSAPWNAAFRSFPIVVWG